MDHEELHLDRTAQETSFRQRWKTPPILNFFGMMAGTTRLELATSAVTASVSFEEPDVTSASSVILRCAMLRLPVVVCPPVTRSPIVPTFRSGMRCSLFRLPSWRQLNAERISNCAVRTGLCDSLTQPWHLMHFVLRYFSLSLVAASRPPSYA